MEFYVLWIFLGAAKTQTLAIDHFATLAECEAARDGFISDYNSVQNYSWEMLKGNEARCFKARTK